MDPLEKEEEAPEASVITGIFESRCKLCRMSKTHPDLLDVIHQWRFGENKSYRDMAEEINRIIARDSLTVRPFVISNFVAHFSEHVPADMALVYELQEQASKKKKRTAADPDVLARATNVKRESLEKVEQNLIRWQRIYEALYNSFGLDNVDAEGRPAPIEIPKKDDVEAMSKAHATWADLLTAKERLLKERTFTKEVMQQAVDLYGRGLMMSIIGRLNKARDEARGQNPAAIPVIDALYDGFVQAVKESVLGLYDETVKEIMDRFNI